MFLIDQSNGWSSWLLLPVVIFLDCWQLLLLVPENCAAYSGVQFCRSYEEDLFTGDEDQSEFANTWLLLLVPEGFWLLSSGAKRILSTGEFSRSERWTCFYWYRTCGQRSRCRSSVSYPFLMSKLSSRRLLFRGGVSRLLEHRNVCVIKFECRKSPGLIPETSDNIFGGLRWSIRLLLSGRLLRRIRAETVRV